jgi:hypothetical protein
MAGTHTPNVDVKIVAQLAELGTSLNLGESPGNRVGVLNLVNLESARVRLSGPSQQIIPCRRRKPWGIRMS